jgi:hypothetical protein
MSLARDHGESAQVRICLLVLVIPRGAFLLVAVLFPEDRNRAIEPKYPKFAEYLIYWGVLHRRVNMESHAVVPGRLHVLHTLGRIRGGCRRSLVCVYLLKCLFFVHAGRLIVSTIRLTGQ